MTEQRIDLTAHEPTTNRPRPLKGQEDGAVSQEPEQIREEIDQTRSRLSQDVDTLAESAEPSAVVGRRVDRATEAVGEMKDRITGQAEDVGHHRKPPLAAGLVAFGIGWLAEAASAVTDAARSGT